MMILLSYPRYFSAFLFSYLVVCFLVMPTRLEAQTSLFPNELKNGGFEIELDGDIAPDYWQAKGSVRTAPGVVGNNLVELRGRNVFFFGESSKIGARHILEIAEGKSG